MLLLMSSGVSTTCWDVLSDLIYPWLQEALADNAEIVTASRRLARELRAAYDAQQLTAGRKAWLTPPIRSWQNWLNQQMSGVRNPASVPTRLDAISSAWVMENCIREQVPEGLPGIGGIARMAVQSWQRLREWQVPLVDVESSARGLDEQVFARAAADYSRQLETNGWVDGVGMADLVAGLISSKEIDAPVKIVFAGFDRLVPAVRAVSRALNNAGCEIAMAPGRQPATNIRVQAFDSMEAELRAAGAWARSRLNEKPAANVAIISPMLEANAGDTARLVREGLVPGWQYGGTSYAAAANISYGRKLAEYPAIAIALLLLKWIHQGLNSREVSLLLRSPCIGGQEMHGRCRVELELRTHPDRAWSTDEFLRVFGGREESQDAVEFFACVAAFAEFSVSRDVLSGPAEWAQRIDAALNAVHWPGDAVLESAEFQLVNRWRELLNEFARIEIVSRRISLAEACHHITALASDTLFQPESGQGLVKVLGVLEAAGLEFDHVWICGLDSAQWPPVSRPALFIANELQRKHEMPDATPGDTLAFARRVHERLAAAANNCVMSWAQSRDGLDLAASSLLEGYGNDGGVAATDPGWYAASLIGKTAFEDCRDDSAPPVDKDEHVRGGAYTVQRQHVEPFGAFVYGRLGVRAPEPIQTGLSPGVRGNIIHNALHNLLASKPDQNAIAMWSEESREQRIGSAIDSALAEYTIHVDPIMRHVIGLERNRLRQLMQEFISAESERPAFTVVDVEKRIDYAAFGILLGLRIDRIDRLANGQLLVIDYKTGLPKNFLNRAGEPTDLQLVVYADAIDADVGGLALINVDSRVISYKGAGGEGGPWKASDDDEWEITLGSWRAIVHEALQNIACGDVRIDLSISASDGRALNILSRLEERKRDD